MPFTCQVCGKPFSVPEAALSKYPGWTPKTCLRCKNGLFGEKKAKAKPSPPRKTTGLGSSLETDLSPSEVLDRFTAGPYDGVFTDGACSGNPGPGGWGVVWVEDNQIVEERNGGDPQTTNNRMELMALITAYELLPEDAELTIWSDSQLCVNTFNDWAYRWEAKGWKKKGGIKNLDLVQRAFTLVQSHPKITLRWIKAHNGSRWNEYADALARQGQDLGS